MKNEEIEKIKMILEVINIKLSINSYSPIIYIPFVDFPDQLKRFEISLFLYKLSDELKIIKFTQITDGQKLTEQQVCVVVEDRSKFYEFKKSIDEKYKDITSSKDPNKQRTRTIETQQEQTVLGPLSYKNNSIYYNDSILDLTPQIVKLCKLFMERHDEYISDESIRDAISKNDFISTENMQKLISKLRTTLRKKNSKIDIERIGNAGYNFMMKKIL